MHEKMKKMIIFAGGKSKNTPFQSIVDTYVRRMSTWSVSVQEVSDHGWHRLKPGKTDIWVALCQRGKVMDSPHFAKAISAWMLHAKRLCFLVGPSEGLLSSILDQSHHVLSLSPMTWPHLMARAMLVEQIYRAQQQLRGHGYALV